MRYLIVFIVLTFFSHSIMAITCRDGYSLYNNKCLKIVTSYKKTRSEAKTECIYDQYSYLARHLDQKDLKYIDVFTLFNKSKFWVGLSYKANWDDGTILEGAVNGEKVDKCIYLQSQKYYSTNDCQQLLNYICMQN